MASTSVVIHDFDFVRVAFAKFETNAPAVVHRHRPFSAPIAFELVQATLFKGLRSPSDFATFRANSKSTAASKSSPRNWFGRSPSHTLRAAEFRHDLIMARTYYGKR
jgi:hypothetical protein